MYLRHSQKYGKNIKIIHPGEYYVTGLDEMIGTLLGSCVAVVLWDDEKKIGGMNHFMLPGRISENDIFKDRTARYGITAINELMKSMVDNGALRKNITAKIFGGGHVLENDLMETSVTIPMDNIRLARVMMEIEDVPIIKSDVGEHYTRKLLFDVHSGKVYLKKTQRADVVEKIAEEEKEFAKRSFGNG